MSNNYKLIIVDTVTNEQLECDLSSYTNLSKLELINDTTTTTLIGTIDKAIKNIDDNINDVLKGVDVKLGITLSNLATITDDRIKQDGSSIVVNATHLSNKSIDEFLTKEDMSSYELKSEFDTDKQTILKNISALEDEIELLEKSADTIISNYNSLNTDLNEKKNDINKAITGTNDIIDLIDDQVRKLPKLQ